jgi:predicted TIM-barrel fold metal-dependent hydrolase
LTVVAFFGAALVATSDPACGQVAAQPAEGRELPQSLPEVGLYDYHTHVFSPAASDHLKRELKLKDFPPFTASDLLGDMDHDHVQKAAILSVAYRFAVIGKNTAEQTDAMTRENDFAAAQAGAAPTRLVALFSVNPLADNARAEMLRCARSGKFVGLKLHFANSRVDLRNREHIKKLKELFQLANKLKLPVVIHLRTTRPDFGREDALTFIRQVLRYAPAIPVQIAHAGGWGGYDKATDDCLNAFADAMADGTLRGTGIYFDVSAVVRPVGRSTVHSTDPPGPEWWPDRRYTRFAEVTRRIGVTHFLFGTDWPDWTPRKYLEDLATNIPFRQGELDTIVRNRTPWME